ncbi:hypothetical protein AVEN_193812-1 [Araneus ventricosus]|uniref:Uncharacterized protein n=1 Tax=Araneus ventricosus TaxID=182803 RepID=A0A4Y2HJ72_ARAVE|nr:hypothetical protein AVEN_193812-1 [Araneus ventricosus]
MLWGVLCKYTEKTFNKSEWGLRPPTAAGRFFPLYGKAAVAKWQGLDPGTGGSQARNPIPLKIRRVWGLLHAKSYIVAKRPPVGVARKFGEGGCQLRCRPRHLIEVQNYEVLA